MCSNNDTLTNDSSHVKLKIALRLLLIFRLGLLRFCGCGFHFRLFLGHRFGLGFGWDGATEGHDVVPEKIEAGVVKNFRLGLDHLDKQLKLVHLGFWQR